MHAIIHPRRWARALVWTAPLVLVACLAPPDVPRRTQAAGDSPGLLPIASILARTGDGPNTARLQADPNSRIASLRARAAALRGPVIPADQRQRMLSANARLR